MVISDMRYMWSAIDSPLPNVLVKSMPRIFDLQYLSIPNRRQPSRLVVLRRSSIWKNGTGESECSRGGPPGNLLIILSTVHCSWGLEAVKMSGAGSD